MKKKCLKFKAIIVKLKEKTPSDPKKKKSLQKKEKHNESSSDSDLDNEGWNIYDSLLENTMYTILQNIYTFAR